MNVIRKMKFGAFALSMSLVFAACSSDDDVKDSSTTGNLKMAATASYTNEINRAEDNVSLEKFIVNFKEIELEFQDDFYNSKDEIELKGPLEIDLLSGKLISLINIEIPNGIYEEIEFEFDKSENSKSEMFGKSMKMTGAINGVPFEFWHDFDEEIEIDFEDSNKNLVINNNTSEVIINFNLNTVVDMVDFSKATDNDGDGVITISPQDLDGNNALAQQLKDAIKAHIDLMDDLD